MPAPNWTADNVTEVAVRGHWSNGRQIVSVFFVQREEDDAPTSARDVLNNWQDEIMDTLANNYVLDGAHYRDRNEASGVVGDIAPDPAKNQTGQTTGQFTPPNVALLVRKNAVLHAGQRPGRLYLPGIPEASVDEDGTVDPAYITGNQPSVNAFLNGLSGAGGNQLTLVHFTGPSDASGTKTLVTAMPIQTKVATQRRRLRG